jgi:hypothetical protein
MAQKSFEFLSTDVILPSAKTTSLRQIGRR